MTSEQAITVLQNLRFVSAMTAAHIKGDDGKKAEKEMDAIQEGIEALRKQIPQKPTAYRLPSVVKKAICPRCLMVEDESANYCRSCGQALDWGDNNDS